MLILALALIAQSTPDYQSARLVIPANTTPCVAKSVSLEEAKVLARKLRRQGYAVQINNKVVSEGITPTKPSLMRGYKAVSGC